MKSLSTRSKWLVTISISMSCGILSLSGAQKLAAMVRGDIAPSSVVEVTQLKQDNVHLLKQLADYKTALGTMQNQLTKNQTLLKHMLEQKQALLQANKQGSLDSASEQKLKEYEQYIAKLESEIETIRQSYLDNAKYHNVLNIDVTE